MINKPLSVMTILGTRPEIIRLSRIITKLDKHCNHTLVHTGQNFDYELNEIFFEDMGIRKPDVYLECAGANASDTIAEVISKTDKVLEDKCPEAVLILGDTNSSLAAIPAKRRNIPIFHMEAGNRCFDLRVPEEINRKIVDHISDINLPYSSIAREYLLAEGLRPETIIKTGSPLKEVLNYYKDKIDASNIIEELKLKKDDYFLVSSHRQENIDSSKQILNFVEVLNQISETYKLPVVLTTHPRTRNRIKDLNLKFHSLVRLEKPFGFCDYVNLQQSARLVLSDSGSITEESSILNFPAINIRDAHERPEGMEEAAVIMTGMEPKRIANAIEVLDQQRGLKRPHYKIVEDYDVDNVSEKVLKLILSYTDYVNRTVWKKY